MLGDYIVLIPQHILRRHGHMVIHIEHRVKINKLFDFQIRMNRNDNLDN